MEENLVMQCAPSYFTSHRPQNLFTLQGIKLFEISSLCTKHFRFSLVTLYIKTVRQANKQEHLSATF